MSKPNRYGQGIPASLGPVLDKIAGSIVQKYTTRKTKGKETEGKLMMAVNDYDSRTHAQLQAAQFSGIRANNDWLRFELWILGRLHTDLPYSKFLDNPNAIYDFYLDAFGLKEVGLEDETAKAVIEAETRKAKKFILEERLKGKKL